MSRRKCIRQLLVHPLVTERELGPIGAEMAIKSGVQSSLRILLVCGLDPGFLLPGAASYFGLGAGGTWQVVTTQSHRAKYSSQKPQCNKSDRADHSDELHCCHSLPPQDTRTEDGLPP